MRCRYSFRKLCVLCRRRHNTHQARNLLAKIPAGMQAEVKDAYRAIFDTGNLKTPPGPKLTELIDARVDAFASRPRTPAWAAAW